MEVSTAWNYASRAVELWPAQAREPASRLVYPPLLKALRTVPREGRLRDLMERLQRGPLRGDAEWREVADRHAHLRLARLCVDAEQA